MEIVERDPQYIADTLRLLRKMHSLTQENLADIAGKSPRTIEKAESGRHCPEEQTLRSIARALGCDVQVFAKPTPEQERRLLAELERSIRKTAMVQTTPIEDAGDFLRRFGQPEAFRFDMSAVNGDKAMEIAASMFDYMEDVMLSWSDVSQSDRLACAREFTAMCERIKEWGYLCHLGCHRQQLRYKDQPSLVFQVALFVLLPKDKANGERFSLVELEGAWETLDQDRAVVPEDWCKAIGLGLASGKRQ